MILPPKKKKLIVVRRLATIFFYFTCILCYSQSAVVQDTVPDSIPRIFKVIQDVFDTEPELKEQIADSFSITVEELEDLSKRKKKKLIRGFLGSQWEKLNNIDTTYITPQFYDYAFMLQNTTTYEEFSIIGRGKEHQKLRFAPRPTFRLGGYFGWRWLFLGYTFDLAGLLGHKSATKQKTELDLSFYTSKLGIDLYYRKTGRDFRCLNLNSLFDEEHPRLDDLSDQFNGLNIQMRGFNVYYIFNHRHFSYPAAFSQSTVQRKSAGTFKLGFSFTHHKVSLDETAFDDRLIPYLDPSMFFESVKYNDYSITFGYAYNWVFAKNFLLCLSCTPGLAYNVTYYKQRNDKNGEMVEKQQFDFNLDKLNFDFIGRLGLVYNNTKYFVGLSFIYHSFDYKNKSVGLNNSFGSLNVYAGFNFKRKKEFKSIAMY